MISVSYSYTTKANSGHALKIYYFQREKRSFCHGNRQGRTQKFLEGGTRYLFVLGDRQTINTVLKIVREPALFTFLFAEIDVNVGLNCTKIYSNDFLF